MRTRVLKVDRDQPEEEILEEAASILRRGGLVAFATETVYGLGAIATDRDAVSRIFHAKGRPAFNPLIVHVADVTQARPLVEDWPESAERLADRFWPGPLTLVLRSSGRVPENVTGGRPTVAVRAPETAVARRLIRRAGAPLAAPSANRSNRLSPTTAAHVLGDLRGRIELILDSGPTTLGLESTVLDLSRSPYRILRPGPIGRAEISGCLGRADQVTENAPSDPGSAPASPGMLEVHYAPRTPAWRCDAPHLLLSFNWPESSSVLVLGDHEVAELPPSAVCVRLTDPRFAAANLYRAFHEFDAAERGAIVVIMPPDRPEWSAVRDRVIRATRPLPAPENRP